VSAAELAVLAGIFGAIFGSFFNVVAYRLPRGESLSRPPSRCPTCRTPIRPYDNIPIIGWLLLRGRCRACGEPISPRYPIVEALTAALAVGVVLTRHSTLERALGLALVAALVPISLIDLDNRIIPNKITGPASIVAIAIGLIVRPAYVPEQLISGVAGGGFLLIFAIAYPRGLGMGDVKLAGMMGLFLGRSIAVALFAGILSGAVLGAVVIARVGVTEGRKTAVPFGPFLALGGVVALFVGPQIVHWYLHSMI
jgi:leader peptidase (prepilin peptidase) / N-methyltransferase